ncbi:alpha/beta hydrolase, partial [Aliiglaciecola sp.]|nr:alpha/beta hydrolase [Aliiglaciecola sp.]
MFKKISLFIAGVFFQHWALSSQIFSALPDEINPQHKYIFYSHGYIVEGDNPKPVHHSWGVYDYPEILVAMSNKGTNVISEHRAAKTNPYKHAQKLTEQVNYLIGKGVPSGNITLIGFSRGGFITAITSSYLKNKKINYVILAACTSGLGKDEDVKLYGHVLSIFETSDTVGSCNEVVKRNPQSISSFTEISISTGAEHGAFYRPIPEWVNPVKTWIDFGPQEKVKGFSKKRF